MIAFNPKTMICSNIALCHKFIISAKMNSFSSDDEG